MLKIGIFLLFIAVCIAAYGSIDRSKEAELRRAKFRNKAGSVFRKRVYEPYNDFIYKHTRPERMEKREEVFRKAGLHINYASGIFIAFISAIIFSVAVFRILHNPFMAIVFFGVGWNVPSLIVGFIVNRRLRKLDAQIGMFMRMVIKRYQVINDFYTAFVSTIGDFAGEEPIYSELSFTRACIERGDSVTDALMDFAKRVDNKYMVRFADYYAIAAELGTEEARKQVLGQALVQYEEHVSLIRELNRRLSETAMEAYIMLWFVPVQVAYQIMTNKSFVLFYTTTLIGQIGSSVIVMTWLICFWFISVKIAAPLEKE